MVTNRYPLFLLCSVAVASVFVTCVAQQPKLSDNVNSVSEASKRKVDRVEASKTIELSGEANEFAISISSIIDGPSLVVLNGSDSKQLLSKPFAGKWAELKSELDKSGILVAVDDQDVTYFVQGRKYVPSKFKATPCTGTLGFKRLYTAYTKLTPKQRESLLSKEGLIVEPGLANVPKEMQEIVEEFRVEEKTADDRRWNLKLQPAASTLFPYVSAPRVAGWWQWDAERLRELQSLGFMARMGYSTDRENASSGLEFPDYVGLPESSPKNEWRKKKVAFGKGQISKEDFKSKVALSSGLAVQVSEEVLWPVIYSSGSDVVLGSLLDVLTMSNGLEVRYLEQTKVLYIAPSSRLVSAIGIPAIDGADYPKFSQLLSAASESYQIDFGPLQQSIFAISTSTLPERWTGVLLADISPTEAWEGVGIDEKDINSNKLPTAVKEWLKLYNDTPLLTVPGINLLIQGQTKSIDGIPEGADFGWFTESEASAVIYPTCL